MTPTARTLAALRKLGYSAGVVEKWNAFAGPRKNGKPVGQRQDLFGFIDIVAVKAGESGVLAVQACARSGQAARRTKILGIEEAKVWLAAKNRIQVWSWAQPEGSNRWTSVTTEITALDFADFPEEVPGLRKANDELFVALENAGLLAGA